MDLKQLNVYVTDVVKTTRRGKPAGIPSAHKRKPYAPNLSRHIDQRVDEFLKYRSENRKWIEGQVDYVAHMHYIYRKWLKKHSKFFDFQEQEYRLLDYLYALIDTGFTDEHKETILNYEFKPGNCHFKRPRKNGRREDIS